MLTWIKKLRQPNISPLNTISISKKKIKNNISVLQKAQPEWSFFPVLKSNAYGHGILPMIKILQGEKFPYIAVDSFPEYQIVHHNSGFNILIMGETLPHNYRYFDFKRTTFAVYNLTTIQYLASLKKRISLHLFFNTGMNREGIQIEQLEILLEILKKTPQLKVEGLMSHLHSADGNPESIQAQINIFKAMTKKIEKAGFYPQWRHIAASAGIFNLQDSFFNAARPGLALYGHAPCRNSSLEKKLQPALSVDSTIISLQHLKAGEGASYGHIRKTKTPCTLATIPFGYYEGIPRSASGKFSYFYEHQNCPQVGTICMNLSTCLATPKMEIGERISIISDEKGNSNTIEKLADTAGMIPYELLIRLDKGIRREIID